MSPDPDSRLPDDARRILDESTDKELQAIVRAAQRRLTERRGRTDEITPRHEGEEILSTEDHGSYTLVIAREDWSDEPQAYHVSLEPDMEGEGHSYRWRYIGPVDE